MLKCNFSALASALLTDKKAWFNSRKGDNSTLNPLHTTPKGKTPPYNSSKGSSVSMYKKVSTVSNLLKNSVDLNNLHPTICKEMTPIPEKIVSYSGLVLNYVPFAY